MIKMVMSYGVLNLYLLLKDFNNGIKLLISFIFTEHYSKRMELENKCTNKVNQSVSYNFTTREN